MFRRSIFTVFTFRAMESRLSLGDAIWDCRNGSATLPAQAFIGCSQDFDDVVKWTSSNVGSTCVL
jgi:hypothetical protein